MTLDEVKQKIVNQRNSWLDTLVKDGGLYATGKVSAFDYVLELLSKVRVKNDKK